MPSCNQFFSVATWKNGLRFPMFKPSCSWDFPGGPGIRTPSSHCWGARFDPSLLGNLNPTGHFGKQKRGERVSWSFTKTLLCLHSCNKKPRESVNTSDVLDDALPTFPTLRWEKNKTPSSSQNQLLLWGLLTNPQTFPPCVPLYPPLPQETETSPSGVMCSGTSCHPASGSS